MTRTEDKMEKTEQREKGCAQRVSGDDAEFGRN